MSAKLPGWRGSRMLTHASRACRRQSSRPGAIGVLEAANPTQAGDMDVHGQAGPGKDYPDPWLEPLDVHAIGCLPVRPLPSSDPLHFGQ